MGSGGRSPQAEILDIELKQSLFCLKESLDYQYCLVYAYEQVDEELKSLQPFRNAAAYAKEFGNYESGSSDNYYDYYMQACETDARLYSEDVTYEYFKKIEDYALLEELDE